MTTSKSLSDRRVDAWSRRVGYSVSVAVNVVLLVAVLGWPGWEAVPFLTDDFRQIVGWVVAALGAGIVTNSVYAVTDSPAVRAVGELVVDAIGLVALIRLWQVFPFDFGDTDTPWSTVVRVVLAVGIAGTAIAMVVVIVQTALRRRSP
ncbi:hypothetical protein JTZ10_08015 [Gordonia rubripertincta]|uniref:Phage holin family protein n=1 Tax=Gordonia rubripertincta TaxID=36822 RepID=A0AAW4G2Z3_GORRU|nr:hypothetical protein [Gordonia rubripertincta]MBM7277705.1 hypothetical protein [Gordonia rubripertincta]